MSLTPVFKGKIVHSRFYPNEPDMYELWLGSLEGEIVDIAIKKYRKNRTDQQNRYLHGVVLKIIGEELGYTLDETRSLMAAMFLKDFKEVNGKKYVVVKSTTSLKTDEFSAFVENIKRWASQELNIFIPEAESLII